MYNTNKAFPAFPLGYTTEEGVYLLTFLFHCSQFLEVVLKETNVVAIPRNTVSEWLVPTVEDAARKAKAGLKEKDIASLPFSFDFSVSLSLFHNATTIWAGGYGFVIFIKGNFFPWYYQRSADLFTLRATLRWYNENGARTQFFFRDTMYIFFV